MLLRFLFFLGLYVCVSQSDLHYILQHDSTNIAQHDSTNIEQYVFFEINNIGDPILFLMPKFVSSDNALYHYSQNVRNIDFLNHMMVSRDTTNFSQLYYSNCYNEGGFLQSFLTRPVGRTSLFKFSYSNLSSKGFYNQQLNKFSNLSVYFDFFSDKYPYGNSIFFHSLNADYQLNGGLVNYDSTISTDLLETHLGFATTNVKKREFSFLQYYLFNEDLKFNHKFYISHFQRDYTDSSPFSFYYTLTPLSPLILDYNLNTFFSTIDNTFSVIRDNLEFSINHIHYNTNNLNQNKINGDFFISINSNQTIQKKIKFNLSYCPLGYNKKNYLVNIDYNKYINNLIHYFSFNYVSKKPNFFTRHYDNDMFWNWNDFSSINQLSLKASTVIHKHSLTTLLYFNRSVNYLYFNDLASPVQLLEPLNYVKMQVKKTFKIKSFSFNSLVCVQYSNSDALSVPLFLLNQEMVYKKSFMNNINLSTKLTGVLFSTYYPDAFFPLTDVFYQQRNIKNKIIPLFSGNIYISKNNFSIGFVFDHLSSAFVNDNFLVPLYTLPQPVLRFSVKWIFLD